MDANQIMITVETIVHAPVEKCWEKWINPSDIIQWNNASDDWFTPRATNDLKVGGKFLFRMEARDGSSGFDFEGVYDLIKTQELITYHIIDGRKVTISFKGEGNLTKVSETFEAETENPVDLQRSGWQSILDNFKKHVESE